jgi:hypothetical protein
MKGNCEECSGSKLTTNGNARRIKRNKRNKMINKKLIHRK